MAAHGFRWFFSILIFFSYPALAATAATAALNVTKDTVTVDVNGSGNSRDEAIATALSNAVIKVQGKAIPAKTLTGIFLNAMRDERKMRTYFLNDSRIRSTQISTALAFVQDYQVLECNRIKNNQHWQTHLQAEVVSPQARQAQFQQTIRLALLPFQFIREEEAELGGSEALVAMRQTLADIVKVKEMTGHDLGQHPRIEVHAIPPEAAATAEKAGDRLGSVDWKRLAELANVRNFITVEVDDFRLEPVILKRVNTGVLEGRFIFNYHLIHATQQQTEVLKSGVFMINTRDPALRQFTQPPPDATTDKAKTESIHERMNLIQQAVAVQFSAALLRELLPPMVFARDGDKIILNAGTTTLQPGDRLAVLGPDFTEPDAGNGLVVRQDGMRIAVLEVTTLKDQHAVARVVQGESLGVQPGAVLRRLNASNP